MKSETVLICSLSKEFKLDITLALSFPEKNLLIKSGLTFESMDGIYEVATRLHPFMGSKKYRKSYSLFTIIFMERAPRPAVDLLVNKSVLTVPKQRQASRGDRH